jgi:hypothetical protein
VRSRSGYLEARSRSRYSGNMRNTGEFARRAAWVEVSIDPQLGKCRVFAVSLSPRLATLVKLSASFQH